MLYYQDDKRYIIQKDFKRKKIKKIGPYETDMTPEIKNADGTDRQVRGIPGTSEESVYNKCLNLRDEFIGFIDPKYKNLKLKDIKIDCALKAEWQCSECNHKWVAVMEYRAKNGQSCPYCCKQHIQFPEKYIFHCLSQIDNNLQENYKIPGMNIMEFDMYDPALKLAIEFSSEMYHQNQKDSDERKLQYAISQNIRLIRIWQLNSEKQVDKLNKDEYIVPVTSSINGVPDLDIIIDDICQQYNLNQSLIDRKLAQDQAFLRTNKTPSEGKSLKDLYPDLCRDWDYSKNGVIRPEMLRYGSEVRVHWKCFYCGQEWSQQPNARTAANKSLRAGCRYCNRKIGQGLMQEIPYIPDNKSNKT